jgi:hypothetical protein
MAAPEYVPVGPLRAAQRSYQSPPRRPGSWRAERPGEVVGEGQPRGQALGAQGPEQGYILRLAPQVLDSLHLQPSEDRDDVKAGLVAVALRRASLLGRAPVVHDLRVAATLFGFYDATPSAELIGLRSRTFTGLAHTHHYFDRQALAASVPEETLLRPPDQVADAYRSGWRAALGL